MSNIDLIIEERAASIGSFLVGRLLPFREKRSVGPFVFIDHMGPVEMDETQNMDIASHPHIGLSTLTFLFEGSVMHRDSLGTEIQINPGAVNWMTSGKGIVHSERTPNELRNQRKKMHGLQIWVALPKELENMDPEFAHIKANDIPSWEDSNIHFKLIAGEVLGRKSPVPVFSQLYFLELKCKEPSKIDLSNKFYGEIGIYILEGSLISDNNEFLPKQLLVSTQNDICLMELSSNTTIYIFGGEPFPEQRFIEWNFVSSNKETIEQAKADWKNQRFPKIPGEVGFVPLPEPRK